MTPRARRLSLLFGVASLAAIPGARAEAPQSEADRHENRAVVFYNVGDYPAAIHALEQAYAADPKRVGLLYNLGAIHRRMGDKAALLLDPAAMQSYASAVDAFRKYLEYRPDAKDRTAVETEIAVTEAALKTLREEKQRSQDPPPPSRETDGGGARKQESEKAKTQPALVDTRQKTPIQVSRGVGEIGGGVVGLVAGAALLTVGFMEGREIEARTKEGVEISTGEVSRSNGLVLGGALALAAGAALVIDGVRRVLNYAGVGTGLRISPAGASAVVGFEF